MPSAMQLVFRRGAVLADVDRLDVPDLCRQPRRPVDRLRTDPQPFRVHVRKRGGERQHAPARRLVGCGDVELRRVDVEADEIVRRADDLQFVGGEFRRVLAGDIARKPSVYLPSSMTPRRPAFSSRVAISAARTFSGVSNAGTQAAMFSAGPTLVPARPCARIACTARPCASTTWCRPGSGPPSAV